MARADEGAFIEALIASERIGDWLAAISAPESSKCDSNGSTLKLTEQLPQS